MLLHASLLFFFAGLVGFLIPVNRAMTWLMVFVLVAFLLLYITITILPLISLDSPYFTPLSEVIWRLWNKSRAVLAGKISSSNNTSMSEELMEASSRDTSRRDGLAVEWTVATLTDEAEFLNFIDIIPGVICGPKAFRSPNFHLFFPLLEKESEQMSLSSRIMTLLQTTRTLSREDALRIRCESICLKAIWALAMIADLRSPELHSSIIVSEVHGISDTFFHKGSSEEYTISANAAKRYNCLIRVTQWIEDRGKHLVRTDQIDLEHLESLISEAHSPYLPSQLFRAPGSSISTEACSAARLQILGEYLFCSYLRCASSLSLPYQFHLTIQKILPEDHVKIAINEIGGLALNVFGVAIGHGSRLSERPPETRTLEALNHVLRAIVNLASYLTISTFETVPVASLYAYFGSEADSASFDGDRLHLLDCIIANTLQFPEAMERSLKSCGMAGAVSELLLGLDNLDGYSFDLVIIAVLRLYPALRFEDWDGSYWAQGDDIGPPYQLLKALTSWTILQGISQIEGQLPKLPNLNTDILANLARTLPLDPTSEIDASELCLSIRSMQEPRCITAVTMWLSFYASNPAVEDRFLRRGLLWFSVRSACYGMKMRLHIHTPITANLQNAFANAVFGVFKKLYLTVPYRARSQVELDMPKPIWRFTDWTWVDDWSAALTIAKAWRLFTVTSVNTPRFPEMAPYDLRQFPQIIVLAIDAINNPVNDGPQSLPLNGAANDVHSSSSSSVLEESQFPMIAVPSQSTELHLSASGLEERQEAGHPTGSNSSALDEYGVAESVDAVEAVTQ